MQWRFGAFLGGSTIRNVDGEAQDESPELEGQRFSPLTKEQELELCQRASRLTC